VKRLAFAIPGDPETLTGGYAYDRRIIGELRRLGWTVDIIGLGEGFPWPDGTQRAAAMAQLLASRDDGPMVIDGLAFGVLPEAARALATRRPVVALVHHPLALEGGLTDAQATQLADSERQALAAATRVIATSRTTADLLRRNFAVPAQRLDVVVPGTDRKHFASGGDGAVVQLLSVAAIGTRKGFETLVEALAPITDLPWHLTIAGDRQRDPAAVGRLDAAIARHGLERRITSVGTVPPGRLAALQQAADLFVLASEYEGYGMAYAEALACGLPVIGTTGGAIPEVVPPSAGRLVPPGDVAALTEALRALVGDRALRQRLADGAREAARALPSWKDSGVRFAQILDRLA
jgi:glycosyltransferase involved in cell wall biosynthesis